MRRTATLLAVLAAGCGTPPKSGETVWATVTEVYTAETLQQPFNGRVADPSRVVRVGCGIGTSYAWGSYALLPPGVSVSRGRIVRVAVRDPGQDERLGWNEVLNVVEHFPFPGSSPAYRFIPDWRERGLRSNLEPIPLAPPQRGRYVNSHSDYLIKCRQPDGD